MKLRKKLVVWAIVLIGATSCLLLGLLILPDEPTLRMLGLFLYVYICMEFALQISISLKREKEGKLREKQKDQNPK